jgi:hypothetical protein
MRAIAAIVAALCTFAFAAPAEALGLTYCDNIKNDQDRMACLQQHISHLEETILALSGRIAALEDALDKKLGSEVTYKIQSVEKGGCLAIEGDQQQPGLVGCDHPDAWKMLAGPPIKKPEKPAPPPAPTPGEAESKPASTASPTTAAQGAKAANPCRALSQMACAAKPDVCAWKPDKQKCGKK